MFQALLNGAAVNVLPHADIDAFIAATAAGEVTWTSSSFSMMRELIACLEGDRRFERGRLRYVRVASGRLEPAEMDRLEELLGVPVVTGLASSETGTTAQQRLEPPRKRGSVGAPVSTEVRLVDDDGRVVAPGKSARCTCGDRSFSTATSTIPSSTPRASSTAGSGWAISRASMPTASFISSAG
jgi:acyl-CoA synthetase (AMP-forming)/AMP-acid ligase II